VLALALQDGRADWMAWVGSVPAFGDLDGAVVARILDGTIERQILWDEAGVPWLGLQAQDSFGRKNFLELLTLSSSPPLFTVLHGRHELGTVAKATFVGRRDDGPPVLVLEGRVWRGVLRRATRKVVSG
jgi:ATP-dependent helicase Lhr and Lhr-like helicase